MGSIRPSGLPMTEDTFGCALLSWPAELKRGRLCCPWLIVGCAVKEGVMIRQSLLCAGIIAGMCPSAFAQQLRPTVPFAADRKTAVDATKIETLPATILPPLPVESPITTQTSYSLDDLVRIALQQNPRLAQAALSIDAARGRALQAGLYPNPVVSITGDELGDRDARTGIITVPQISQEFVTGGKLTLSRAAAERAVDQATLALTARRAELLASVRSAYFDLLALQQRVELFGQLRNLTQQSVDQTKRLMQAKQATQLDVVQLEVEAERIRAEAEATEEELPAAFRQLAAAIGVRELPVGKLTGSLGQSLPSYELDRVRHYVLEIHPDMRSAQVAVDRAKLLWQRRRSKRFRT